MAPKRSSGRKVVASVVKTTRRVVEVVVGGVGNATTTTKTTSDEEFVEEVIGGGGETEEGETTTTTPTTVDIPVEDVEATTTKGTAVAGKRRSRVTENLPTEEERRMMMMDEETETQTQEPEFPVDDPKIYKISTPPRVELPPKHDKEEPPTKQTPSNRPGVEKSQPKRQRSAQSEKTTGEKEKGPAPPRRKRRRVAGEGREGYKRYIHRVLKQVHPDLGISGKAMTVVNNFMTDMFERLAFEAGKLSDYGKRQTMTAGEVQAAVKLVLPGELGKHAVAEGSKAVVTYMKHSSTS